MKYWLVLGILVVLQFSLRARLGNDRVAPDFLLLALLIYAIRARPAAAAVAGFVVGLLGDALTPASFGAGALAHAVVGYGSAWVKAVFFAENPAVNGAVFFLGTWVRNAIVVVASGTLAGPQLGWELAVWSPLQGLTTGVTGVVVLILFRHWLTVRVRES